MITREAEWTIDIVPQNEAKYTAESILNTRSEEFASFVSGIIMNLGAAGYLLNDMNVSDHGNGVSEHYEFLKCDENKIRKIIVNIRVSDHRTSDGQNDVKNITNISENIIRHISIPVDIIFNDEHFTDYYGALKYAHSLIKRHRKID